jgi:hypothetical protein
MSNKLGFGLDLSILGTCVLTNFLFPTFLLGCIEGRLCGKRLGGRLIMFFGALVSAW